MSALETLNQKNGLKTTQTVVNKQTSGQDALEKTATAQGATANVAAQAHQPSGTVAQTQQPSQEEAQIPVVKKDEPKPEAKKRLSYAEMFKMLNPDSGDETDEQRQAREKRERLNAKISAIGDGLRALANIYFSTKGAKVIHNPQSDLTANAIKRKELMDEQRRQNRAQWLSGYQRALALDEESRKNDMNLAEQVRYHDQLASNRDRVGDQNDRKIAQNQQKIDLAKLKYTNDEKYKQDLLEIKELLAKGQITRWEAQNATDRLRAEMAGSKARKSSGGNKATNGYWYEYYDMMATPEGQKRIEEVMRNHRTGKVSQKNIKYIMDKVHGRNTTTSAPSTTTKPSSGKKPSAKPSAKPSTKKKSTGVKW